ncbi:MAG: hypothetical protein Q6358_07510, partial [Candidatus Brocadiales bacterium]|nr:hypothetical protein [Candidatus Brocadiales bacterium]
MVAFRLLGSDNVSAGAASCRSRLVQSCRLCCERSVERLLRTFRLFCLVFFLIMPSVFLADTADAAWGTATVDSADDTGQYTSIAVGTSGAAYISYYKATGGDLRYATNVSGSWGKTTVDATDSKGQYSSIAVGTSGAVYISYKDVDNSFLMYATNVSGSWVKTTVDESLNTGEYTSIAVGTSGAAYISYYDRGLFALR